MGNNDEAQKQGQDLQELLDCLPENQLGEPFENPAILKKIQSYFDPENKDFLPRVIGLFGGWGSGKTSLLAAIVKAIKNQHSSNPIIYFNAWKYASTGDILPALIYKILTHPMISTKNINPHHIGQMLISYVKDKDFRKPLLALFLSKEKVQAGELLWSKLTDIDQNIQPKDLEHFFSSADRNIKIIKRALKNSLPSLIIIDELDRCDPDEAYGLIKELKVLFGSRGLPLLFILSVNPEPIGMAIKKRYGFDQEVSDFESIRILEKFVDVKFDIINDINLYAFMKYHFEKNDYSDNEKLPDTVRNACDVFEFDHRLEDEEEWWSILNKEIIQLSNLRIISKCIESLATMEYLGPNLFWPTLNLELIKNSNYAFAKKLYRISGELEAIAHCCHTEFQKQKVEEPEEATFEYFNRCFWGCWRTMIDFLKGSKYRSEFAKKLQPFLVESPEQIKMKTPESKIHFMEEILHDFKLMDSVKHLTLVRVTENTDKELDEETYIKKIFNGLGLLISRRI
jgi:hypothetical protein